MLNHERSQSQVHHCCGAKAVIDGMLMSERGYIPITVKLPLWILKFEFCDFYSQEVVLSF